MGLCTIAVGLRSKHVSFSYHRCRGQLYRAISFNISLLTKQLRAQSCNVLIILNSELRFLGSTQDQVLTDYANVRKDTSCSVLFLPMFSFVVVGIIIVQFLKDFSYAHL